MAESPTSADPASDARSESDPEPAPEPAPGSSATQARESATPFGSQDPTRFAADVEYRGRVEGHDYLVRVRHRLLDSTFTVVIDGVDHDPQAEATAVEEAENATEATADENAEPAADADEQGDLAEPAIPDHDDEGGKGEPLDALQFRFEESFTVTYCTVRRPGADGTFADAEVLTVRTVGVGGAGEVDVRHGLERWPLVPEDGSPSAVRDEKRLAHPTRYAALAALTKALTFLLPLIGLGALLSGVLDPVVEWVAERIRPLVDLARRVVDPIREFLADLLRPVREFLADLLSPVREVIAALLQPLVEAWNWVWETLRGWLPTIDLGVEIPPWVADVALPLIVVVAVFTVTFGSLRQRREKLAAARAATAERAAVQPPGGQTEDATAAADGESTDRESGDDGEDAGHGSSTA